MAVAGDRLMDRYELIEPLGSGGMATVWRATDVRLRRQVAVKILRPEYAEDEAFVRRLEVEARHAASLQHANVATVFDTGSDGDTHFIVMELADGPTVADLLRHRGFLVAPLAVEIAAAAARALAAAHRRGLVHRDVKPANLLVARDGTVRLADFGIARALAANRVTVPGIVLGSIPYLSPEQARGDDATPGGDIFSLGVVLFEMLTGRLPWGADSPAALATVRLTTPPLQASTIRTDLPSGLDAIVERALDLEPARRYPSARAFAETLETWLRRFAAAAPGPTPDLAETVAMAALVAQPPGMAAPVAQPPGGPAAMAALVAEPPATAGTDGLAAGRDPRRVVAWAHARLNPAQVVPVPPARVDTVATRRRRGRSAPAAAGTSPARSPSHLWERAGIAAVVLLLTVVISALVASNPQGEVLEATGLPAIGGGASATATVSTGITPEPSPRAAVTPAATSNPRPSPTPERTPKPKPNPKPKPTPKPTPKPKPNATVAPAAATTPGRAVGAFYDAAEAQDWGTAIALWSPRMREQYPPEEWLIGRFRRTTRIDVARLRTVAVDGDAGRATVAVTLVEYRTVEPSPRTLSGTWDLVRRDGRWLLDRPHF